MVKIKRKSSITLIVIASLILFLGLWHTARMMAVKYWMEDYLKKEYGKEFVVNKVGYRFSYYGDGLKIKGVAHPKDDPSLKFDIVRVASGGVFREFPRYGEFPSYISNLWSKQKREEIETVLGNDLFWVGINSDYNDKELYGRTISVKEAEKRFKNQMELFISYVMFVSPADYQKKITDFRNLVNGKPSQEQAKKLYGTINKLKNNKYNEVTLIIKYFNKDYQKEVAEEIRGNFRRGIYEFNVYEDDLLCEIRIRDINNIAHLDDIGPHIDIKDGASYLNEIR